MVTHEFSGALLLCLPPSALSVIAVHMPPVRHSLLTASMRCVPVRVCVCVFLSRDVMPEKRHQGLLSNKCRFLFRQTSFPFDILQSSKSLVFGFYSFHHLKRDRSVSAGKMQQYTSFVCPFSGFHYLSVGLFTQIIVFRLMFPICFI